MYPVKDWYVYVLKTSTDRIFTGVAKDVEKQIRIYEILSGKDSEDYEVCLQYLNGPMTKSNAQRHKQTIDALTDEEKRNLSLSDTSS